MTTRLADTIKATTTRNVLKTVCGTFMLRSLFVYIVEGPSNCKGGKGL